jgi:hypothetical protein
MAALFILTFSSLLAFKAALDKETSTQVEQWNTLECESYTIAVYADELFTMSDVMKCKTKRETMS